mgnify:FL=1
MKGYWLILGSAITDQTAQDDYGRLWAPIAARYGARLVRDAASLELKDGRDTARVLLVEFPDLAAAQACYADPAYAEARDRALAASRRDLLIFAGALD